VACRRSTRGFGSEEAASVAEARERALAKAEAALGRIRNGLGGRYCKTRKQAGARVAQILTGRAAGLITVRTGTKTGKPWITWARNQDAIAEASRLDGLYALAANLPDPGEHSDRIRTPVPIESVQGFRGFRTPGGVAVR
jgi:hypothetical protein